MPFGKKFVTPNKMAMTTITKPVNNTMCVCLR